MCLLTLRSEAGLLVVNKLPPLCSIPSLSFLPSQPTNQPTNQPTSSRSTIVVAVGLSTNRATMMTTSVQLRPRPKYAPPEGSLEEAVHLGSAASDLLNKKPSPQRQHTNLVATTLLNGEYYAGHVGGFIDVVMEKRLQQQQQQQQQEASSASSTSTRCTVFLESVDECVTSIPISARHQQRQFDINKLEPEARHFPALSASEFYNMSPGGIVALPTSVYVDKWGFMQRSDVTAAPTEGKKVKDRDPKPERWPEVLAKWDSYSEDKRKKVQ
jgi:hypothetical protein